MPRNISTLIPSGYRINLSLSEWHLNQAASVFSSLRNAMLAIFEGDMLCYKTPKWEYWVNIKLLVPAVSGPHIVPHLECIFINHIKYEETFAWLSEPRTSRLLNIGVTASWLIFMALSAKNKQKKKQTYNRYIHKFKAAIVLFVFFFSCVLQVRYKVDI